MFKTMKLGVKLALAFAALFVVALVIAGVSYSGMNNMQTSTDKIANVAFPSLDSILKMRIGMANIVIGERGLLLRRMGEANRRDEQYKFIDDSIKMIEDNWKVYAPLPQTAEEKKVWDEFVPLFEKWKKLHDEYMAMNIEKDKLMGVGDGDSANAEAIAKLDSEMFDLSLQVLDTWTEAREKLNQVADINAAVADEGMKEAETAAASSQKMLISALVVGAVFAFALSLFFIRNISGILSMLMAEVKKLTDAALAGKLDTRANVVSVNFEFQPIAKGFNDVLDAVIGPLNVAAEYIDRIGKGDIPQKITDTYHGDFNEIKNNLNNCIDSVNGLIGEAGMLSRAAVEGRLATRGNPDKFEGAWAAIVQGVNETLDSVIGPLNVAAEYIDRISKGDIPKPITEAYYGDFNEIKNNLNGCIETLNGLIAEMNRMSREHDAGEIDWRMPDEKFSGAYGVMAKGLNDMVFGHIAVKKKAMACVAEFSRGNYDAPLEKFPGKKAFINENIELLRTNVKALIAEAGMLTQAAVQGKLATRGNPQKFQGAYAEIVKGVNDTLDAVIGPLNVAAEYIDRIGKGDMPPKIVDAYYGDFNEIKNNLNNCIESINGLIAEAGMLTQAAVQGKLATRGNPQKFQGAYAEIVKGVNDTLDAVIGPLNVAAEYVDRISKGDIPPVITDNYNGDFNEFKNNLNQCIETLNGLIAEMNRMSREHDAGEIDWKIPEDNFQGAYTVMAKGVNDMVFGHIAVKKKAMACVAEFAKGNYNAPLEKFPGKKAFINDNIELLRANVKELIAEAAMLSQAAVAGKLTTRGNVGKFQGAYADIVRGVNDTLDAVIKPVNEAAEILRELAACNFAARVRGDYQGDHALIKNNLNQGMEAVQAAIKDTSSIVSKFAAGDLTVKAEESNYKGDIIGLARDLNSSIEALRNVIQRIRSAASSVASAADEISAASDQITKGAQSQATAADETSASMEQMSVNIMSVAKNAEGLATNVDQTTSSIQEMGTTAESVAKNAESMATNVSETSSTIEEMVVTIDKTAKNVVQADNISKQASDEARAGGEAVLRTVDGMKRISEMMSNISGVIQSLGQRSEAIGNIVEVIEEIADQTNLLALNAAIEAARAGEAGRGFAVVADEVRKLAERSVKATKEIGEVIKQVQAETAAAVKVTEEGAKNSKEGIELADKAGAAINRIMEAVNGTSQIMQEISRATSEQSNAAKNVIKAVEEMNRLTQSVTQATKEQASGSKQVVKAAEAMAMMTEQVKNATSEQKKGGENVVKAVENISDIAKANLSAVEQLSRSARDMAKQSESLQELVQEFSVA